MTELHSDCVVPVDVTNPGQFFACCGLFELANLLWPGVEACFDLTGRPHSFRIHSSCHGELRRLLETAQSLRFPIGGKSQAEADDEHSEAVDAIAIEYPVRICLDWWADKTIKTWAGSMKCREIFRAMLDAIDAQHENPMNHSTVAVYQDKKKEPFYFDSRRGNTAHPLDSGFSPDANHLRSDCYPAVEALCFVGLQRARPMPTGLSNQSRYVVWTDPLPINVIAPVVSGQVPLRNMLTYRFDNFFRTDQRKHKSFSRATLERKMNA